MQKPPEHETSAKREAVVLIHGLGAHWALMQVLRWRLQRAGFATFNWGYRSWWGDVETHAEAFATWLSKFEQCGEFARIHIVAHSLGSIVTRCMLVNRQFPFLGRIVMLCPPNRGSHMATLAAGLLPPLSDERGISVRPLFCKAPVGPLSGKRGLTLISRPILKTLQQIVDGETSWVNQLPQTMPVETGVVVARGDRVVRPAATQIDGVTEYVEVPGMHTAVLFRRRVAELCVEFLRTGHFTQGH